MLLSKRLLIVNSIKNVIRPVHLLRVFLSRVLESNFPMKCNGHENFHPLELRVCLSQTL